MRRPDLATDPRFRTNPDRLRHVALLDALVADWVGRYDRDDVLGRLQAADVPASPIYSVADIVADPHYWARQMLLRVQDERLGSVVVPGVMPKLAATPGGQRWLGPRLGEHTQAVLQDVLGLPTARRWCRLRDDPRDSYQRPPVLVRGRVRRWVTSDSTITTP